MLQAIFPVNSVHPELASKSSKEASARKQSSSRGAMEAVSSGIHRKKLRSDHTVAPEPVHRDRGAEASAWPLTEDVEEEVEKERATVSPNPSTLSFVNIDSYEPDSSDAEEDGDNDEDRELDDSGADSDPSAGLQRRLDSMINDLGKDFDYLTGLHSYLRNRLGASGGGEDPDVASCSSQDVCDGGQELAESASEQPSPIAPERTRCDLNCETVCVSSVDTDVDRCGVGTLEVKGSEVAGSLNSTENSMDAHGSGASASAASSTEMVVRPKIRKQTSETHLEKKRPSSTSSSSSALAEETLPFCGGGGSGGTSGRSAGRVKCGSAPPFFLTQTERPGAAFLFDLPKPERCRGGNVPMTRSQANGTARRSQTTKADEDDEDDFWEDLEEFSEKCASARKGDDRYVVNTQFNIPSSVWVFYFLTVSLLVGSFIFRLKITLFTGCLISNHLVAFANT